METTTVKKQSNRAIQKEHATYKPLKDKNNKLIKSAKTQVSEALHLIKPFINESTYKFLSHFRYTPNGTTQMSIIEWCKKVGIATGTYSKIVKPEIENTFSQSLIIKIDAPMKYDKKRKKKVKACEFKSLIPLSVIEHLIKQKEQQERLEDEQYWIEIETIPTGENIQSDIDGDIDGDIASISSIPCESKDEGAFQQQHNKSFRENHLENNINTYNRLEKNDSILKSSSKKSSLYNPKKSTQELFNEYPFVGMTNEQKSEYGKRIDIFVGVYRLHLENNEIRTSVIDIARNCFANHGKDFKTLYQKNPYKYFYASLRNGLMDEFLECTGVNLHELTHERDIDKLNELEVLRDNMEKDYKEFVSKYEDVLTHAYDNWISVLESQYCENEVLQAYGEMAVGIEDKPKKTASQSKQGKKNPIRSEIVPNWLKEMDEPSVKPVNVYTEEQKAQFEKEKQALFARIKGYKDSLSESPEIAQQTI